MEYLIILWYKIRALLWMYSVGTYYTFKQFSWKADKSITKPKNLKVTPQGAMPLALITGGTKGIGFELAKLLVRQKFSLIIAARDKEDGKKAVDYLTKLAEGEKSSSVDAARIVQIEFYSVDLSDLSKLAEFVDSVKRKHKKLHLLVNNAALMMTPYLPVKNKPYEIQWAVNVVGTIYLAEKFLDLVKKAAAEDGLGRIINLSSSSQFSHFLTSDYFRKPMTNERYSSHEAYSNTKVAVALYTRDLQKRLAEAAQALGVKNNVLTCCLHPGVISTGLYQHLSLPNRLFFSNPLIKSTLRSQKDAAWDMLYLCLTDAENLTPGAYYENNQPQRMSEVDQETQREFESYVRELIKTF